MRRGRMSHGPAQAGIQPQIGVDRRLSAERRAHGQIVDRGLPGFPQHGNTQLLRGAGRELSRLLTATIQQLPTILICNHTSALDPMLIQSVCRRVIVWMMAKEYYEIRLMMPIFRALEVIPVDRGARGLNRPIRIHPARAKVVRIAHAVRRLLEQRDQAVIRQ